jgi:hypothetical protein
MESHKAGFPPFPHNRGQQEKIYLGMVEDAHSG